MKKNTENKSTTETLRQKAEELLKMKSSKTASSLSEVESLRLIHELEVHQIELELQNEELGRAWADAEVVNDKYIRLYDFAPLGYFTLSGKGEIIELNLTGARMLGKDRQYLKSSLFGFFVSDATKQVFNLFLEKAFRTKAKESCEITLISSGNRPVFVHLSGIVTVNQDQCLVTMIDITERKLAEDALHESEKQRISVLNNITDVVWSLSWPDLKVNFISPSVEQVYGRSVQEFEDNPSLWAEVVYPDDKHISDKAFEQLTKEGSAVRECRIVRPDGSIVWINDKSKIIIDQNGKPTRIDGVSRDITERKRVEEELRIKEERYRLLAQNTRDVVYTMNLDGTITFVSPAVELLRGLTVDEAMHQPLDKILTPDSQVISIGYVQQLYAAFVAGQPLPDFHGELEYYRKDMSILMTESFCYPVLENDGSSVSMIGVTRDITERKKAETELLKAKADAEAANNSKSTFLANMSHEIRTPLNAIIGFSQLMNREKSLSEMQKEYITSINRAGEHLLKLINDILELSKIEAGRVELKPTNFDLHALLNDMRMIFKERVHEKQLQMIFEIPDDLPKCVFADDQKLRQIFINLIGNAIKFTDHGGVTVVTRVNKVNGDTNRLIVEIQDSGPGIPEDELGKLFKQFELTSAGIRTSSGTGLGLALSLELAMLMDGNITVKSTVGKGSVFTIDVVVHDGVADGSEAVITKRVIRINNPHDIYRILVVDDKEENRQVVVSFLKLVGFQTNEAINGEEAITKFEQWNPHLILMDFRMPVMDGYEATRLIKTTEKGKQTPIIAMTASLFEDKKENTPAPQIQGYIRKPFHENELFAAIGKALGIGYIYEEETSADTPSRYLDNPGMIGEELSKLPTNFILQMQEAIEGADFHLLIHLIKTIENDNSELARHLLTKAHNYDYIYLQKILISKTSNK
jgi:two-component system CheB/CheR fusion protein